MINIHDISPSPCKEDRSGWTGELISADGASTEDFSADDVAHVIQWATTGRGWDGETAGLIQLKDGRFVAWEADWGPTGDGFFRDAYGGTADLIFASTEAAALHYLSQRARDLLANSAVE